MPDIPSEPAEPLGEAGEDVPAFQRMREAEAAAALAMDAGRSAAAILRAMRKGDHQSWQALVSTLTELERGYLCGALASFANSALNMCDQLSEIARDNGAPIKASSDDVLNAIALGFQ